MTTLRFTKMVGAGNDFIVVDARAGLPDTPAALATRLCPRRLAVGADGLIAITGVAPEGGGVRVTVDFRNADGSLAGFCGNGARCTARFAALSGWIPPGAGATLAFPAITVAAELLGDDVRLELARPEFVEPRLDLAFGGATLPGARIRAGVDHVVLPDPAAGPPLSALAAALFAARPDLDGEVNLTMVRAEGATLHVRTFERGVGETLACGSGALAAALFAEPQRGGGFDATVIPPAGVRLRVRLAPAPGPATLEGEARIVYTGSVEV